MTAGLRFAFIDLFARQLAIWGSSLGLLLQARSDIGLSSHLGQVTAACGVQTKGGKQTEGRFALYSSEQDRADFGNS